MHGLSFAYLHYTIPPETAAYPVCLLPLSMLLSGLLVPPCPTCGGTAPGTDLKELQKLQEKLLEILAMSSFPLHLNQMTPERLQALPEGIAQRYKIG